MPLHRSFAVLLLGLPMAAPIAVVAEDASLAPEVQRRVAVEVLVRRIRGYAAIPKASSDCQVEKGRLPRRQARQALAILLEELGISRRVLVNPLVVAVSPCSTSMLSAVRTTVRTPIAIVVAPARSSPPLVKASGRSGSELNRSSPRVEAILAFVSTPVPTAMPTAARSAVSA